MPDIFILRYIWGLPAGLFPRQNNTIKVGENLSSKQTSMFVLLGPPLQIISEGWKCEMMLESDYWKSLLFGPPVEKTSSMVDGALLLTYMLFFFNYF